MALTHDQSRLLWNRLVEEYKILHPMVEVPFDDGVGIWIGRVHDLVRDGRTFDAAWAQVQREIQIIEGRYVPPPVAPDTADTTSPLIAVGRHFTAGGRPYHWRKVTSFALLAQIAQGREADADAWLRWAKAQRFRGVRVLGMCDWLGLTPARGLGAWPVLRDMLSDYGLRAEVVVLADTKALNVGYAQASDLCTEWRLRLKGTPHVAQVANEPFHATQADYLHDRELLSSVGRWLDDVPYCLGAADVDESTTAYEGGSVYITRHLDRGRDAFNMVRRIRELESVAGAYNRPTINGEMIGADERDEAGRRCANPSVYFAAGALGRLFDVGATFHLQAGLRCEGIGPVQQACAEAFIAGVEALPGDAPMRFQNANNPRPPNGDRPWPDSPVQLFDESAAVRAYSGLVSDTEGYVVVVGATKDPGIDWGHGWHPTHTLDAYPGVIVHTIAR